jgi:hypothetical protein
MIVKYAGGILADVNKVYVINITDQSVQSYSLPFVVPQDLLPHSRAHYWTYHADSVALTFTSKSTTCPSVYF